MHDDPAGRNNVVPESARYRNLGDPPTGMVTFLFTDIEGSTRYWEYYPAAMQRALAQHDAIVRSVVGEHAGYVFTTAGDAFSIAFQSPGAALDAALEAQRRLNAEPPDEMGPLRVRMALHTGDADERDGDYFGPTLNRCARLLAAAHGGQVLVSLTAGELVRDSLPDEVGLRDLGEHRFRDLARPERVFQLLHPDLPAAFPSIRSLDTFSHNLPVQVTSFVGRARELERVQQLVPESRLLTLTGVGGSGKTRLALQAAADLVPAFHDGVWLVELGPLVDGDLIADETAAALGIERLPGRSIQKVLIEHLRSRKSLLILDNCEHLIDAVVELLDALLRVCPELQVLATSREALGMAGEVLYRVPSLKVPAPGDEGDVEVLSTLESVRLFVDRAGAVRPGFELTVSNAPAVAAISRRLDGIPLAIELAASRIRAMSPEQLLARLDDRFALLTGGSRAALPRQQTLAAAMDWSYELLTYPEQLVLQRLSPFRGGFTLEAAEEIGSSGPVSRPEVFDVLSRLVDKSLVVAEERGVEMRYRLFETVRTYAQDKLNEREDGAATLARYAGHYLAVAEEGEAAMRGPGEAAWLQKLEAEHDNLRSSIEWSIEQGDAEMALRFCWALMTYWVARGFSQEGLRLAERALLMTAPSDSLIRGRGMVATAMLVRLHGDTDRSHELLEQSEATFAQIGADHDRAVTLLRIAATAASKGDDTRAAVLYAAAKPTLEEAGDVWGVANCVEGQAELALNGGDLEGARALLDECLELRRRLNHPRSIAQSLVALGSIALAEHEYDRAGDLLEEALALFKGVGSKHQMASTTMLLGRVESVHGDLDWAESLLTEATRLSVEAAGVSLAADLLGSWAVLVRRRGFPVRAVRMWAAEAAYLAASGLQRDGLFRGIYESEIDALRSAMSEEEFDRAWRTGTGLSWIDAIELEDEVLPVGG